MNKIIQLIATLKSTLSPVFFNTVFVSMCDENNTQSMCLPSYRKSQFSNRIFHLDYVLFSISLSLSSKLQITRSLIIMKTTHSEGKTDSVVKMSTLVYLYIHFEGPMLISTCRCSYPFFLSWEHRVITSNFLCHEWANRTATHTHCTSILIDLINWLFVIVVVFSDHWKIIYSNLFTTFVDVAV